MALLIVIATLAVILALMVIVIYNSMVNFRNNRENAFADIDVQLHQRHDLVPQLVEVVRGYAKHESNTLQTITEARSSALKAGSIEEKIAAENNLSSALQGLKLTVENYPDLKANQNFMQLQEEISDIENKIAASRRFFNSATNEYNTYIQKFPANILAAKFSFHKEKSFDLLASRAAVSEAPKIQF